MFVLNKININNEVLKGGHANEKKNFNACFIL